MRVVVEMKHGKTQTASIGIGAFALTAPQLVIARATESVSYGISGMPQQTLLIFTLLLIPLIERARPEFISSVKSERAVACSIVLLLLCESTAYLFFAEPALNAVEAMVHDLTYCLEQVAYCTLYLSWCLLCRKDAGERELRHDRFVPVVRIVTVVALVGFGFVLSCAKGFSALWMLEGLVCSWAFVCVYCFLPSFWMFAMCPHVGGLMGLACSRATLGTGIIASGSLLPISTLHICSLVLVAIVVAAGLYIKSVSRKGSLNTGRLPLSEKVKTELTPRESEAIELSAQGFTRRAIADKMRVSPSTVGTYVARALEKLGVDSVQSLSNASAEVAETVAVEAEGIAEPHSGVRRMGYRAACGGLFATFLLLTATCFGAESVGFVQAVLGCMVFGGLLGTNSRYVLQARDVLLLGVSLFNLHFLAGIGFGTFAANATDTLVAVGLFLLMAEVLQRVPGWVSYGAVQTNFQNDFKLCDRATQLFRSAAFGKTEVAVLVQTLRGRGVAEIAHDLHVAPSTVATYRVRGYRRFRACSGEDFAAKVAAHLQALKGR